MIQVAFFRREGELVGFEASGHANYDDYGKDIVCAGVSAILLTALDALIELVGVKPEVRRNDSKGLLRVIVPHEVDEVHRHDISLLLNAARNGVAGIVRQYPEHVRLINRIRR